MLTTISPPDLSTRPYRLSVERDMTASPATLYEAWTKRFDAWFAAPGSVLMRDEANTAFFFETHYEGERRPHYGRFLALEPDVHVEMTWVTSATKGVPRRRSASNSSPLEPVRTSSSHTRASPTRNRGAGTPTRGRRSWLNSMIDFPASGSLTSRLHSRKVRDQYRWTISNSRMFRR